MFQEAVENGYLTFGYCSPMIFLGKDFWTKEIPIWPLLQDMMERGKYKNLLLYLTDDLQEIEQVLKDNVGSQCKKKEENHE